jgi:hypothetical protein
MMTYLNRRIERGPTKGYSLTLSNHSIAAIVRPDKLARKGRCPARQRQRWLVPIGCGRADLRSSWYSSALNSAVSERDAIRTGRAPSAAPTFLLVLESKERRYVFQCGTSIDASGRKGTSIHERLHFPTVCRIRLHKFLKLSTHPRKTMTNLERLFSKGKGSRFESCRVRQR